MSILTGYLTATGQVLTGTCFLHAVYGCPDDSNAGSVLVYSGTAATAANLVAGLKTATVTNTPNGNAEWFATKPVKCVGGVYAAITTADAIVIEYSAEA